MTPGNTVKTPKTGSPKALFAGVSYYPLVFLGYLAVFIAAFPDVVFGGLTFAKRDILRYYYPVWHFAVESLKHGTFPLWNPYNSFGAPFFADIQTCVFYPMTFVLYLPNYLWAFNFYILLHLAMCGFFTCLWMRDCGASREAAFLSGLAFCLGGYAMSAINLTISLCSVTYFPLVLLCFRRAFRTKGVLWKALGGAALCIQYLAGDPAVVFCTLVVGVIFTIFKTLEMSWRNKKISLRHFYVFAATVGIFIGLSAFHWPLFAEFLKHSNRADPTFDRMTMWSMQYNDLLSFFFPHFSDSSLFFMEYFVRQSWLEECYSGITVLLLAIFALKWRRTDMVGYATLLFLFGVGLALGRFSYLYKFLYDVFPFFKFIRYPIRFVFVSHFALACLAGFGLDALLMKLKEGGAPHLKAAQARWLGGAIVLSTLVVIVTMIFAPQIEEALYVRTDAFMLKWTQADWTMDRTTDMVLPVLANIKRTSVLVLFFLTGVLVLLQLRVRKALLTVFFLLLVFADLFDSNVIEMRVDGKFLESVGSNMKIILKDKSVFRAHAGPSALKLQTEPALAPTLDLVLERLLEILCPNLLLPHRVSYTSGYDSLFLQEAYRMNIQGKTIQNPAEYRYLNMLNIKYVVSKKEKLDASYELLNKADPVNLFENKGVLPRAFLVPKAIRIQDPEETLKAMITKEFDPAASLYLQEEIPAFIENTSDLPRKAGVDITHYAENEARMEVFSERAQWLFLSDSFYPGWKAQVNGKPAHIYKANYMFRAIQVPAGHSSVRWNYDPILFKIGVGLSLVTCLALAGIFWRERRPRPT